MKTYLSTSDFVQAYTDGLRAFLEKSFSDEEGKGSPHHIEDLTAWTATYSDAIFQFAACMPRQEKCKCNKTT